MPDSKKITQFNFSEKDLIDTPAKVLIRTIRIEKDVFNENPIKMQLKIWPKKNLE